MEASEAVATERNDAPYYCPGCGKRGNYPQKCTGRPESPHPEIEMVDTTELAYDHNPDAKPGEQGYHTPAPDTEHLG